MTKLPVYEALISSEDDGIVTISLVDEPAVESDFVCFAKDAGKQLFALKDSAERLITGCLMKADTLIYRNDNGYEYYIVFSKKTIQTMARKMLSDGTFKNIDSGHAVCWAPCPVPPPIAVLTMKGHLSCPPDIK